MLVFAVLTIIIGIAGCVLSGSVIGDENESDAELQSARILVDGILDWTKPLMTDIEVVDSS